MWAIGWIQKEVHKLLVECSRNSSPMPTLAINQRRNWQSKHADCFSDFVYWGLKEIIYASTVESAVPQELEKILLEQKYAKGSALGAGHRRFGRG